MGLLRLKPRHVAVEVDGGALAAQPRNNQPLAAVVEAAAVVYLLEASPGVLAAAVAADRVALACRGMRQPAPEAVAPVLSPVEQVELLARLALVLVVSLTLPIKPFRVLVAVLDWLAGQGVEASAAAAAERVGHPATLLGLEASAAVAAVERFRHFLLVVAHSAAVLAATLLQLVLPEVLAVAAVARGLRLVALVVPVL